MPISFKRDPDETEHPVFTVLVDGHGETTLLVMGEPTKNGRVLTIDGLHIQGAVPNSLGPGKRLSITREALEEFDFDATEIVGGIRTSGANPGRTPRPLRVTRRSRS